MEIFSLQFKGNVKGFKTYIKNISKMFAVVSTAILRVYYKSIGLKFIVGIFHYFDQTLHSYRKMPDIYEIDDGSATEYRTMHEELTGSDADHPSENFVKPPTLSVKTWTDWDEIFRLKLSQIKSRRSFLVEYVANQSVGATIRANANKTEVKTTTINDRKSLNNPVVRFGAAFKHDN